MSELIEVADLGKSYGDGKRVVVLNDLSMRVREGEKVVIVGQSGVGKSTLLHIIGALDRPTSGTVCVGGIDITRLDDRRLAEIRNREIGFVFQFHHLLPDFSALENVMMPALIRGQGREGAARRARELLEQVGLGERLTHRPGELSGGEQQRVAIARAVSLSPRLILADEPSGNLDPETAEEIHGLLEELNRVHGATLVIVTHNEQLMRLADRTLRLVDGHIAADA